MTALGTSGSAGDLAGQYLNMLYPFFAPMVLIFLLEQTMRIDGRPNLATGVMGSMFLLNILLGYLFLFPMQMGIGGAALATGLSQSLGVLIFLIYYVCKNLRRLPGLRLGFPGGGFTNFRIIVVNGSSELFNSLAVGLTTFLFNRTILTYCGDRGRSRVCYSGIPVGVWFNVFCWNEHRFATHT
ncbi:MAG TPA: hypothetical protein VLH18_03645 [Candidatus Limnocylindrales bacterium]|nr:hypothetical protein [Candidatus Limnocylindrales bacterium]